MKKRGMILAMAAVMILSLAACGSQKETSKEAKTYACSKEYETATAHLEDIIVEDNIYSDLSEALGAFKDGGIPIRSTACAAAVATTSACGSAIPTSSAAQIMILLAINLISSPAYNIFAR